jgi:flagellar hook-associated protein 3 FlgL
MRITNLMSSSQVLANINNSENALSTTQEQLSTGLTINQPSDNPYGASLAISLKGDMSGLSMYQNNVTDGTAWATAADTAMQNIANMTQRVQELVVAASNGTQSASDLQASAAEINQLTTAIEQAANTQYNGQYVFSGTSTNVEPYQTATGDVFQGNTGQVLRSIGPNTSVAVNSDLSSVLGSGTTANDGLLLNTLRNISADMTSGTTAGLSNLSTTDMQALQNNLNSLTQLQAANGAVQNRLQLATTRISGMQTSDTEALSNDEDVNMAQAMTTYTNQQAAFTAALRAGANIVQSSLMDFLSTS